MAIYETRYLTTETADLAGNATTSPRTDCQSLVASAPAHMGRQLRGKRVVKDGFSEVPLNPTGKVLKIELRAPYWQGQSHV